MMIGMFGKNIAKRRIKKSETNVMRGILHAKRVNSYARVQLDDIMYEYSEHPLRELNRTH